MRNDLISRQAAIEALAKESQIDGAYGYMDTKSIVDLLSDLPSAERHGRWVDNEIGYSCSICLHGSPNGAKWNYCPNCGAIMEAITDD